jgi:hypothetical protein
VRTNGWSIVKHSMGSSLWFQEAVGADGGKVRLRTPEGQPSIFNDYKAAATSMNSFKI